MKLSNAIAALKGADEVKELLGDLLSEAEYKTIEQRLEIAELLNSGVPYKKIEEQTGASSATIAKVNEQLQYGTGYKLALSRVKNVVV